MSKFGYDDKNDFPPNFTRKCFEQQLKQDFFSIYNVILLFPFKIREKLQAFEPKYYLFPFECLCHRNMDMLRTLYIARPSKSSEMYKTRIECFSCED